jgi:ferritin-like metal-binding protein YciE
MTINTARGLLIAAIQDLFDGELAWADALSRLADDARDRELTAFVQAEAGRAEDQGARLRQIAQALDTPPRGAPNIWLRAIAEDASRDTQMIARGAMLDIAMVGALRKGVQAQRVSYETAIALAAALGMNETADRLNATRTEEAGSDAALAEILNSLTSRIDQSPSR